MSATYSADYSPRDKFGKNFFDEWTEVEWNYFYNTMVQCLQTYLIQGLVKSEPLNLLLTKLINFTCEEFVEFSNRSIVLNSQIDKKQLYEHFLRDYPEYKYKLRQRTFTQWLSAWGDFKKLKVREGHTGNIR